MPDENCYSRLLIIPLTLALSASLSAQPIWIEQGTGNTIAIEALKPKFKDRSDLSFTSSAIFLSGRFAKGDMFFVAELPVAHGSVDNSFFSESETTLGNPYIGVEIHNPGSGSFFEFGGRIPLAPSDRFIAPFVASLADFDRIEAFGTEVVTINGKVNFLKRSRSNVYTRVRVGPTIWIPTGDGDSEIWFDYSAQAGFGSGNTDLLIGLTGRLLASESGLDLGERTIHHLGASASIEMGKIRPGIHFRLPLDKDLTDTLNFSYGLNLVILSQ